MATSNSVNFNLTATEIIEYALFTLGVLDADGSVDGSDYTRCLRVLNAMVKSWQAQGIHLWTESLAYIFIVPGQQSYKFGGTSPDRIASENIKTELSDDHTATDTTLEVNSTTNMVASDVVGIELDDGTMQWTTIVSVDSATQITTTAGLTSAAAEGNNIYVYASAVTQRPYEIKSVRLIQDSGNELLLHRISREQYLNINNKDSTAVPVQYYVDKQRDHSRIYVFGTDSTYENRLAVSYSRLVEDFDVSTDDADFPQEWIETLGLQLASRLALPYGKEEKAALPGGIHMQAQAMLMALKAADQENATLTIVPRL